MGPRLTELAIAGMFLLLASPAVAQAPPPDQAGDGQPPGKESAARSAPRPNGARAQARAAFLEAAELARKAQWARALAAFERAEAIKPHPITTYNIGTCLRAIGAYTRALVTFRRALREHTAGAGELPQELVDQASAFATELDQLLVRVQLTVAPADVRLAVDGRPLKQVGEAHYAGLRPAADGERLPSGTTLLALDPGAHVFTFTRDGFATAVVNETFAPEEVRRLDIQLDRLPARLHIDATVPEALVTFDGRDLGPTPLDVARPAGSYPLLVEKEGYAPFFSTVDVGPGQQLTVEAPLQPATTSVFETWWFWTAAAAALAGGVTITYFATRPEPEPPPYEGGTTGWVIQSGFAF